MSKADFDAIVTHALDDAARTVLGGGEVMRMFYAADADGALNIVAAPCEGPDADVGLLRYLRLQFAIWNVCQYAMVSEVWVSTNPMHSRGAGSLPENDPERREAISAVAVRRVRSESGALIDVKAVAHRAITRNPTAVGPVEWQSYASIGGRMTMLLPPMDVPPIPKEARAAAEAILRSVMLRHRTGRMA